MSLIPELDPEMWVVTYASDRTLAQAQAVFDRLLVAPERQVLVTTSHRPLPNFTGTRLVYGDKIINMAKWWSLALDHIAKNYDPAAGDTWDVFLTSPEASVSIGDVEDCRATMRKLGMVMAGPDEHRVLHDYEWYVRQSNEIRFPDVDSTRGRISSHAAVIAGETGIRHDPSFPYWLADYDFEWQHRVHGGTLLIGGFPLRVSGPRLPMVAPLPTLEEERSKFLSKWGGIYSDGGLRPALAETVA